MPDKYYYYRVVLVHRGRDLAFTAKDEAAFSDLLVAAYPDICFIPSQRQDKEKERDDWPVVFRRLTDAKSDDVSFFRWWSSTPPATRMRKYAKHETTWHKGFARRHWPRGGYMRVTGFHRPLPRWDWYDENAAYGWQRLSAEGRKEFPEEVAFVNRVMRLVEKVATNKVCCLGTVKDIHGPRIAAGYNHVWVGHDALRWCREDRNRYISAAGVVLVPPDE